MEKQKLFNSVDEVEAVCVKSDGLITIGRKYMVKLFLSGRVRVEDDKGKTAIYPGDHFKFTDSPARPSDAASCA